ncbi:hypothetical protein MmiHf6_01410 [Methanimicrococcus hongohii]|uniref:DUF2769 domain-containing protein n=1 Tax=Methanimicrococcus hongohii TaxID=3028295 RepID=A0AA96UYA1_9EURY|nr:DUF2769 domain-containing protein [Methanimicrococcus sp. Hf6]WNY22856.1 hypothetical protein MmiHf6_01410 [Methanimicrococcus sp. Hf6]
MEQEQKFGKYFGVCASFHHSKACLCPTCSLRPNYGNIMYCAKGSCPTYGSGDENGALGTIVEAEDFENEKEDNTVCICGKCAVYKQFAMVGEEFCRGTD